MRSLFVSFWFWLLIIALILLFLVALISGAQKRVTDWMWGLFILSIILVILSFFLALIEAFCIPSFPSYSQKTLRENENLQSNLQTDLQTDLQTNSQRLCTDRISNNSNISNISNISENSTTKLNINVPQVRRGFVSTDCNINSLAP